jgi:peptidoglycan/xylan/chitin deacetylase (PgdA/CDA1 family)
MSACENPAVSGPSRPGPARHQTGAKRTNSTRLSDDAYSIYSLAATACETAQVELVRPAALALSAALLFTACTPAGLRSVSSRQDAVQDGAIVPAPVATSKAGVPGADSGEGATLEPGADPSPWKSSAPTTSSQPANTPPAGPQARKAADERAAILNKQNRDPFAQGEAARKVIYLTLDDGPWTPHTEEILEILRENQAKATFFVVGDMARQWPTLIQRIHKEGHALGNHTQNHAALTKLSPDQVRWQIEQTAESVGPHLGPCMRPPYGAINKEVRQISHDLGYTPVRWNKNVNDWLQPSASQMVADIKAATTNKLNLLLHDGGGERANTVEAIRKLVPYWKKQGYDLQTLPICRD